MLNPFLHNPFQADLNPQDPDDPFEKIFQKYLARLNALQDDTLPAEATVAAPTVETPRVQLPESYTSTVGKTSTNLTRSLLASAEEQGIEPSVKNWVGTPAPRETEGIVESTLTGLEQGWDIARATWWTAAESGAEFAGKTDLAPLYATLRREASNDASALAQSIRHGDMGSATYIANVVTQMLPVTLASMGAGMATLKLGTMGAGGGVVAALGRLGPQIISGAGASVPAFFQIKGEMQTQMEREGADLDDADLMSTVYAVPAALLESAFEASFITGKLFKGGAAPRFMGESVTSKIAQRSVMGVQGMARGGAIEAVTEALQTAIEEVGIEQTVSGEMPNLEETVKAMFEGGAAGFYAGGVLGGAGGVASRRRNAVEATTLTLPEQAPMQTAADVPAGVVIETEGGEKVKSEAADGSSRWRMGGKFTSPPTDAEVMDAAVLSDIRSTQSVAVQLAQDESSEGAALKLAEDPIIVQQAASVLSKLFPNVSTPENIQRSINVAALRYLPTAVERIKGNSTAEIDADVKALEEVARNPEQNAANLNQRVTAEGRLRAYKRAAQRLENSSKGQTPETTDLEIQQIGQMVVKMAENEPSILNQFRELAALDPSFERVYATAVSLIHNQQGTIKSDLQGLNQILKDAGVKRSRGITNNTTVITTGNDAGTVTNVSAAGQLTVEFSDGAVSEMSPEDVIIQPKAGSFVELTGGEAAVVKSITDRSTVVVEMPDGTTNAVPLSAVEVVAQKPASRQKVKRKYKKKKKAATKKTAEKTTKLPKPIRAVNKKTGTVVNVDKIGETKVETDEQVVIDLPEIITDVYVSPPSIEEVSQKALETDTPAEVPVFIAGTKPSAPGRHINFILVDGGSAVDGGNIGLNNAVEAGSGEALTSWLRSISEKGNFYLLPQPVPEGMVQYAVELPAEYRNLSKDAKQILGFISGKGKNTGVMDVAAMVSNRAGATIDFSLPKNQNLKADEVSVMRIPTGLALVTTHDFVGATPETIRAYLRRLTDLSLPQTITIVDALETIQEAAVESRNARIDSDMDFGLSRIAEIKSKIRQIDANSSIMEEEVEQRKQIWQEVIMPIIGQEMTVQEATEIDILNMSDLQGLQEIEGIGKQIAQAIVDARAKGQKVTQVGDIANIKGIGPTRFQEIVADLEDKARTRGREFALSDPISSQREEVLKKVLDELPGRTQDRAAQSWIPVFEHPNIDGLLLVLDKETIPTTVYDEDGNLQPSTRDIFHIEYITPDRQVVKSRRVSHEDNMVKVPLSFALTLGGARNPPALGIINEYKMAGIPDALNKAAEEMLLNSSSQEVVTLKSEEAEQSILLPDGRTIPSDTATQEEFEAGKPILKKREYVILREAEEVVDVKATRRRKEDREKARKGDAKELRDVGFAGEATRTVGVGGRAKKQFTRQEIEASERITLIDEVTNEEKIVTGSDIDTVKYREEPLAEVRVPIKLSPDEVLSEVVRDIRDFSYQAEIMSVGEWRNASFPGMYAEIRAIDIFPGTADPVYKALMFEEDTSSETQPYKYKPRHQKRFNTKKEAETYLYERGFTPGIQQTQAAENFAALPDLEALTTTNILPAEKALTEILEFYQSKGYLHPSVRIYAREFAKRFADLNVQQRDYKGAPVPPEKISVFTAPTRRFAGIFYPEEMRYQAKSVKFSEYSDTRAHTATMPGTYVDASGNVQAAPSPQSDADDIRIYEGVLASRYREQSSEEYINNAKEIFEATEHKERFYDLSPEASSAEAISSRLVKVDGQLGLIVDPMFDSDQISVQVFVEGDPTVRTYNKRDVVRVRGTDKARDFMRQAKDDLGENDVVPLTPVLGASPIDKKYAKGATTIDEWNDAVVKVVENLMKRVTVTDSEVRGDLSILDPLSDISIRMSELGLTESVRIGGSRHVPLIPTSMGAAIRRKAFKKIKSQFSPESQYGDLMARAKLGGLTPQMRKEIIDQNKRFGGDPSAPIYRQVEFLMGNVWDPRAARVIYNIRKELELDKFHAGIPTDVFKDGYELRPASGGSMQVTDQLSAMITTPREMGYRSPTIRLFTYQSAKARDWYSNDVNEVHEKIRGLQSVTKMTIERKDFIQTLLEDEFLGAAMSNPSQILTEMEVYDNMSKESKALLNKDKGWNWYEQYQGIREILVNSRKLELRSALMHGFNATQVEFEPNTEISVDSSDPDYTKRKNEQIQTLRTQHNLTVHEVQEAERAFDEGRPFFILDRSSKSNMSMTEYDAGRYMTYLDTYDNIASVPASVKKHMDKKMIDEFDFWKRYGINNYAPRILQGNHQILMKTADGNEEIVAVATDGAVAQMFFKQVRLGNTKLPKDAQLVLKIGAPRINEHDMHIIGPKKFAKLYGAMKKKFDGETATELANSAADILGMRVRPGKPGDLHNRPRTADLTNVIRDPYERVTIYAARAARAMYLLKVDNAHNMVNKLDSSLSYAFSTNPVDKQVVVSKYLEDLRKSYMGIPTSYEVAFNTLISKMTGKVNLGKLAKGLPETITRRTGYSVWSDPQVFEGLYDQNYTTRKWGRQATQIQSLVRLGWNYGGALINATQHIHFTPWFHTATGSSTIDALTDTLLGMQDYFTFNKDKDPEGAQFLKDSGVDVNVVKGLTGPGFGTSALGRPVFFDGGAVTGREKAGELGTKIFKMYEWISMSGFVGAEKFVRVSSAFTAQRQAKRRGFDYPQTVAYSREAIDNTMFQYNDQALPPFMRGPLARTLTQFQQYPLNALKFEFDLLKAAAFNTPMLGRKDIKQSDAIKSAIGYNSTSFMLGGMALFAAKPVLAPIGWLLSAMGQSDDLEDALYNTDFPFLNGPHARFLSENEGEYFQARNFLYYGLPGLTNLNISSRFGVSGLDLNPAKAVELAAGPSTAMYRDVMANLYNPEDGYTVRNKGSLLAGTALGTAVTLAMPRRQLGFLSNLGIGIEAASYATGEQTLSNWLVSSEGGTRLINSIIPSSIESVRMTYDIFGDESKWEHTKQDRSVKKYDSAEGLGAPLFDITAKFFGFQTQEDYRDRTENAIAYRNMQNMTSSKRAYMQQIVHEMERGQEAFDGELIINLISDAASENIAISKDDIMDYMFERRRDPDDVRIERMSTILRDLLATGDYR